MERGCRMEGIVPDALRTTARQPLSLLSLLSPVVVPMATARRALAGRPLHSKRAVRKARNKLCGACVTPVCITYGPCGTGRNYRPAARDDLRGIKSWLAERARVPYSIVPLTTLI